MAAKPESQALMLETNTDSETDVEEFDSSGKLQHSRSSKNGFSSIVRGSQKKEARCPSNRLYCLALLLSLLINVVLFVAILITSQQTFPSECQQVPSGLEQAGSNTDSNHSSTQSATPSSSVPTPTTPALAAHHALPSSSLSSSPGNVTCVTSASPKCGEGSQHVQPPVDAAYVNVFRDLSPEEISAVMEYLLRQTSLQLDGQTGNKVFGVELHVPTKASALTFLDSSGFQPPREALVSLSLEMVPPHGVFRQYVVGPLPRPTYHKVNPRMAKDVPLSRLTEVGVSQAYPGVYEQLRGKDVERVLVESFGATVNCAGNKHCLMLLAQKISFGLVNRTSFTFAAYYRAEFPTIHPVSFQLIVSETHPGTYSIQSVYYAGSSFSSLSELVQRYDQGTILKVSRKFPGNVPGENSVAGSMNLRGEPFPTTPHPPPRQYEPRGPRYSIVKQHVKYLEWSFNVRNSVESSLQLWDITWSGERIVYELSLQEIVVLYAGANPSAMFAHLSDSAFGLGDNAKRMVPSVDCPDHATFLSTWIYDSRSSGGPHVKEVPNTVCVFEHNANVPIRRHGAFGNGRQYGGLTDYYLVVRTIVVEYNYDYIVDVVFHANGALETRVYATGYIMSQWFHYGEDPFGFKVHDDVVGSVHHHLFHFKLDLDVGSVNNRYETLDFGVDNRDWPWLSTLKPSATSSSSSSSSSSTSSRSFQQISFKHHVRKTEQDALYHYDFDHPKYHIFYTEKNRNQFGNNRAYRLAVNGFSKQLLPSAHPAVSSRKWMQYCTAVTVRKEEEARSSSIFSMYDADDPVVNFDDYIKDNDSIIDKDLVVWVTVGMHHIPHTEDIPNTPTLGTEASILLLPYSYFPEDPSMRSRDAVRVDHGREDALTRFQTYGTETDFTCVPPVYGWLSRSTSTSYP